MTQTPVLAVLGPTAAGKSALSMALAKALPVEIVCMDSMQVYQGMDIGTAKPGPEERLQVAHHMLDVVGPKESFSVSQYADMARPILEDIGSRGKLPLLVGGTGLYLKALTQGLPLGGVAGSQEVRDRLHAIARQEGGPLILHAMLREADPASAQKLHPNDLRRVIRALEVYEATGKPISKQDEPAGESGFRFGLLGTAMRREVLYERINRRVEEMAAQGLEEEVRGLLARGVTRDCQSMQGIGYKEWIPVLEGAAARADALERIKRNTRHYAKRQLTWFKAVQDVHWLDMEQPQAAARALEFAGEFWATAQGEAAPPQGKGT